jgi:hypothetical protein
MGDPRARQERARPVGLTVALLRRAGLVDEFPAGALAGVIAGATALLVFLLSAM